MSTTHSYIRSGHYRYMPDGTPSPFWKRFSEATPLLSDAERVRYLRRLCGVSQAAVSRWRTGTNTPSLAHVGLMAAATGFEVTYLLTGTGPSRSRTGDPELEELLAIVELLGVEDRAEVLRFAKFRAVDK